MPTVQANGIEIFYESLGADSSPPILLIMGLGNQMTSWPDEFCEMLVAGGYRVIRFDNRDVGLSQKIDHRGNWHITRSVMINGYLGRPVAAPYLIDDMAADAVGLIDALGLQAVHVVGLSMGGMIAQVMAAEYPQRVLSLTSIMSSSGNPKLPKGKIRALLRLVSRPRSKEKADVVKHQVYSWKVIGSPGYPRNDEELRARCEAAYDRCFYPQGNARQTLAIMASGSRVEQLNKVVAPTLVIHGADDPLVLPACGEDTAAQVPNSRLELVPGMGHDLPPGLYGRISDLILQHVAGAGSVAA